MFSIDDPDGVKRGPWREACTASPEHIDQHRRDPARERGDQVRARVPDPAAVLERCAHQAVDIGADKAGDDRDDDHPGVGDAHRPCDDGDDGGCDDGRNLAAEGHPPVRPPRHRLERRDQVRRLPRDPDLACGGIGGGGGDAPHVERHERRVARQPEEDGSGGRHQAVREDVEVAAYAPVLLGNAELLLVAVAVPGSPGTDDEEGEHDQEPPDVREDDQDDPDHGA